MESLSLLLRRERTQMVAPLCERLMASRGAGGSKQRINQIVALAARGGGRWSGALFFRNDPG